MKSAKGKNSWALFLLMLAGIVLGGFIGTLTADMPGFAWLNYGQSFGFDSPIVLNLGEHQYNNCKHYWTCYICNYLSLLIATLSCKRVCTRE